MENVNRDENIASVGFLVVILSTCKETVTCEIPTTNASLKVHGLHMNFIFFCIKINISFNPIFPGSF